MYPYKLCWDFWKKKVFGGCKSQILFIGDQNAGRGDKNGRGSET